MEKQRIPVTRSTTTYKMVIPREVEEKIRYICRKVWKDEWSGILFYTVEGSFKDGSLIIKCRDIYVMDIGSVTYTEFDMSPDVVSYMANNSELLDCQMGLIHSHNNMSTFFSGTDIRTLEEEGLDRNHFVSLIVNNQGSYTAAITRKLINKHITESFCYPSFGNVQISEVRDSKEATTEELEYYYLDIEVEGYNEHTALETRLEEIEKSKESKIEYDLEENKLGWGQSTLDFEDNVKKYTFNKALAKSLALQLVTGSVVIPRESKINIKSWVTGMVPIYERRFGKGEEGLNIFEKWAEGFIEFLCWFTIDEDLIKQGVEEDDMNVLCAVAIKEELQELDNNVYIEKFVKILDTYIY